MPGLVPGIHDFCVRVRRQDAGGRDKPGHYEVMLLATPFPATQRLSLRGGADPAGRDWRWSQSLMSVSSTSPQHSRSTRSSAWPQGTSGIAHALQDAHWQIEMKRLDADQMIAPLLDQMLGDWVGLARRAMARNRRRRARASLSSLASCGATSAAPSCRKPARSARGRRAGRSPPARANWRASTSAIHPPIEEPTTRVRRSPRRPSTAAASSNQSPIEASSRLPEERPVARIVEAQHGQAAGTRERRPSPAPWCSPCPTESPTARAVRDRRSPLHRRSDRRCGGACRPRPLPGIAVLGASIIRSGYAHDLSQTKP